MFDILLPYESLMFNIKLLVDLKSLDIGRQLHKTVTHQTYCKPPVLPFLLYIYNI